MIPFDTTFEVLSMRKPLRSLLSLLLAVLLLTSGLCTTAIAAGSSGSSLPYTDVSPGSLNHSDISPNRMGQTLNYSTIFMPECQWENSAARLDKRGILR